jgi:signal transduction histidine kinase
MNKISIEIPSIMENIRIVESFIDNAKDRFQFNDDLYGNIMITVTESVSNAIRHGHAKNVEISILEDSADSIRIEISNDGVSDSSDRQGVGSQMLDEITMNWSRELTDSGVRLVAKVAANSLN